MYNVLIVDDEMIVRIGLKMMLTKEKSAFRLAGVAEDGAMALEMEQHVQPDIIVTDLKMAKMDGLTLIRQLNDCGFKGKVIVLSNYGDYEMVREAMTLGAVDYLLKVTLKEDDFFSALNKAAKQLTAERQQEVEQQRMLMELKEKQRLQKAMFFHDLLQNDRTASPAQIAAKARELEIKVCESRSILYSVIVDQHEHSSDSGNMKDPHLLLFSIQNIVSEMLNHVPHVEFVKVNNAHFLIIMPLTNHLASGDVHRQLAGKMTKAVRLYLNVHVSIVISAHFTGFDNLKQTYEMCKWTARMKVIPGSSSVVNVQEIALPVEPEKTSRQEIQTVIDFIDRHIDRKITLPMVAKHVNMNDSYLSRLFKKEMGMTMTGYIQQLRMKKALALLQGSDLRVKEIAASVGIHDPFYFNRIFKKTFGKSPTQFKASAVNESK